VEKLQLSKETPTSKKLMYIFINKVTQKSIEGQQKLLKDSKESIYLSAEKLAKSCALKQSHLRYDRYKKVKFDEI